MANQPLSNLEGFTTAGQNKHYSRPTQYIPRPRPVVITSLNRASLVVQNSKNDSVTPPARLNPVQITNSDNVLEQQFSAPIYLNNYSGEYEDSKYSRFSLKMNQITKKFVVLTSFVAIVLVAGAAFVFINLNNRNIAQAQSNSTIKSTQFGGFSLSNSINPVNTQPYPSSTEPSANQVANYSVAPDLPKYLNIPKLNSSSMITPVNLSKNKNYLGSPSNISNVGWWQESSLPGQTGAVILDGFTSNGESAGVFASISKLKVNDSFQIVKGDNSKLNYKIVKISNFGKDGVSMEEAITPVDATRPSLNIITCSGQTSTCPSSVYDGVIFAQQQ